MVKAYYKRNVEYLQQHNIYDVIVNVHHFADQIIDAINQNKGLGQQYNLSATKRILY
jgi:NDP-sugar pyrophosphorylase family protein